MKQTHKFRLFLALTLCWTAVIFTHSLMPATVSRQESGGILQILQRLLPFLSHFLLRKLAHFSAFAVLGALLARTVTLKTAQQPALPFLLGLVSALCDETIQLFVAGRSGEVRDVWIDFSGVVVGALLVLLAVRRGKRR